MEIGVCPDTCAREVNMKIQRVDEPHCRTYIIEENIDSSAMREFELELVDFCTSGEKDLVVDVGGVSRLDSLVLAVFLKAKNILSEKGRKFRLAHPNDSVRRMIEIASLDSFLLEKNDK